MRSISVWLPEDMQRVGTWQGPSGRLKLQFVDGSEELHQVQGAIYEFEVQHSGQLKNVWFSDDANPELWFAVGGYNP